MAVLGNLQFAPNQNVASDVGYVKPVEGWYPCVIKDAKDVADKDGAVTKFSVTFQIDAAAFSGEGGREFRHLFPYPSNAVNDKGQTGMEQDMTLKFLQMIFQPGTGEAQAADFLKAFNAGAYAQIDPVVQAVGKTVHVYFKPDGRSYTAKSGPNEGKVVKVDVFRLVYAPSFSKYREEWLKEQGELARVAATRAAGGGAATQTTTTQATGAAPAGFPGLNGMPGMPGTGASPFPNA